MERFGNTLQCKAERISYENDKAHIASNNHYRNHNSYSASVISGIYNYAKDKCWQERSDTAEQLASGIASEFEDDVAKLHIMEAIPQRNNLEDKDCLDALYPDTVLPTTMFSRIDIWYPDNTVVSSGNKRKVNPDIVFEEMAADGEQMSGRITEAIRKTARFLYRKEIDKHPAEE